MEAIIKKGKVKIKYYQGYPQILVLEMLCHKLIDNYDNYVGYALHYYDYTNYYEFHSESQVPLNDGKTLAAVQHICKLNGERFGERIVFNKKREQSKGTVYSNNHQQNYYSVRSLIENDTSPIITS